MIITRREFARLTAAGAPPICGNGSRPRDGIKPGIVEALDAARSKVRPPGISRGESYLLRNLDGVGVIYAEGGVLSKAQRNRNHGMRPTVWRRAAIHCGNAAIVAAFFACPGLLAASIGAPRLAMFAPVPVVAELFTSEGCSSCPPADDLLSRLMAEQPIEGVEVIALSEHVDYWNGLGWTDPFSSRRFSERQREYARARNTGQIYTPQLVIDGRLQAVGSDPIAVRQSLLEAARAPRAAVAVSAVRSNGGNIASVRVVVRDLPRSVRTGTIRVVVAVVEDDLVMEVTRGENARMRLRHNSVARVLDAIAALGDDAGAGEFAKDVALDGEWAERRLRVIAFLQDDVTRHILGAGASSVD